MIESIGEVAAQQTNRAEQAQLEQSREAARQHEVRQAAQRAIETSDEAEKAKQEAAQAQSRTRYKVHNKRLVIEKYSKDGNLIMQLPPVHNEDV